jgi:hypothetical protein
MVVVPSMSLLSCCRCSSFCYLPEDRAFEPVGKMVMRLIISIVGLSRRDLDAERNSFSRV